MRVKVLGCTGSMGGPQAPASGYYVELDNGHSFVMDLGPGALAQLQLAADPAHADVLLTHVHPDHIADLPGLLVWRRFHPSAPATQRNLLIGPADIHQRIGDLCVALGTESDRDLSDTFINEVATPGESFLLGASAGEGAVITPFEMIHPVPTVGYRVAADGAVLAYSGDTAYTDELLALAHGADVFICEATWCGARQGLPPGMHLSGFEAGDVAKRAGVKKLVLTHIPPYGDAAEALAAAQSVFDGDVEVAYLGMELGL